MYMKMVNRKMAQNQTARKNKPASVDVFESHPSEWVVIKAKFNDRDILEEALIVDERKEMKIKISRYLDEVTFEAEWRGFSIKLTKGFGVNLPGILYRTVFVNEFKSPLEYYKVILNLVEMSVEKEYEKAQEIYEEEQEESKQ